MKTNHIISSIPSRYSDDPGSLVLVAAAQGTKWAKKSSARRVARSTAVRDAGERAGRYTPDTQPRDPDGKFRKILARLKSNLGDDSTEDIAKQIEATEAAQIAGNYEEVQRNSKDLIKMLDDVADGTVTKGTAKNLRRGATDLGKILAYLPLPQGRAVDKVRFSDLPPASAELVRSMVNRIQETLEPDVAQKYIKTLKEYMSGARVMSSDELAVNLNKLLRVLA